MRHGSSQHRRTRSRGGNGGNNGGNHKGPSKNKVFDSSGPEVRIRGTAHQITEKYMVLAKDATSSGDHVLAQSYMQHAEHYQRLVNEWAEQQALRAKPVVSEGNDDVPVQTEEVYQEEKVLEEA